MKKMMTLKASALLAFALASALSAVMADVSHLAYDEEAAEATTEPPPPRPYLFSYAAGRFPGQYDRKHAEVSDGRGFVKGSYSVLDPRNHIHTVDYIADKSGFHPQVNDLPPDHPSDTEAVALAKQRHYYLYHKIAEDHAIHPHPDAATVPRESEAVLRERHHQAVLYHRIAEEHARIAAEREAQRRAFEATSIPTNTVEEEYDGRHY